LAALSALVAARRCRNRQIGFNASWWVSINRRETILAMGAGRVFFQSSIRGRRTDKESVVMMGVESMSTGKSRRPKFSLCFHWVPLASGPNSVDFQSKQQLDSWRATERVFQWLNSHLGEHSTASYKWGIPIADDSLTSPFVAAWDASDNRSVFPFAFRPHRFEKFETECQKKQSVAKHAPEQTWR
jgi:hypothetical protein